MLADIANELIFGMDIVGTNGHLNLKRGVLQVNEEEDILQRQQEEAVRVVLSQEPVLQVGQRLHLETNQQISTNYYPNIIIVFCKLKKQAGIIELSKQTV